MKGVKKHPLGPRRALGIRCMGGKCTFVAAIFFDAFVSLHEMATQDHLIGVLWRSVGWMCSVRTDGAGKSPTHDDSMIAPYCGECIKAIYPPEVIASAEKLLIEKHGPKGNFKPSVTG